GANPVIETEGYVLSRVKDVGTVTSGVLVRGVDGIVKSSDIAHHITDGKMELTHIEGNTFGIAIGKTLAEKLGASVGSKIRLLAAPKDLTNIPPLRQYVITGIFETGFYEFDASLIYVSLSAAQRDLQWGDLATGIQVRLVNAFEADRVSVELRETLAATYSDMFPTSWMYAQGNLYAWIQLQKWASFVVLSLIVVVAGFNIISILTMTVNERRREIGILKAMGAAPKSIAQIFSREGLIIGASGVLLGNILGGGLCWIQKVYAPISLSGDIYFINALPVTINIGDFAMTSALALLLCLVFARWPAKRAATLDPVEAIRYE
ncbi:MAG: FtsX-like permease family protein, partial [Gemmatimonadota bacterium]|nr:FtsX-like permease family protein [Gemmatimonadota bacterium]